MPSVRKKLVARILRFFPLYSGCGSLANHPWVAKLAGASTEVAWAPVAGGAVLAALDDYDGKAAYYSGYLDRKVNWVCQRVVRPGDQVLDIGANIGMITLELASRVGPSGRVYAFEPNPVLYANLEKTLLRNDLTNVELLGYALGACESSLELMVPRGHAGRASLIRSRDTDVCDTYEVAVKTLSGFVAEKGITNIRMIKIDVEGFEAEVLAGGLDVLKSVQPDAILFEMNETDGQSYGEQAVFKHLGAAGYKFLAIPRCYLRMHLHRFDPNKFDPNEEAGVIYHDFLAVSARRYDEIAKVLRVADG